MAFLDYCRKTWENDPANVTVQRLVYLTADAAPEAVRTQRMMDLASSGHLDLDLRAKLRRDEEEEIRLCAWGAGPATMQDWEYLIHREKSAKVRLHALSRQLAVPEDVARHLVGNVSVKSARAVVEAVGPMPVDVARSAVLSLSRVKSVPACVADRVVEVLSGQPELLVWAAGRADIHTSWRERAIRRAYKYHSTGTLVTDEAALAYLRAGDVPQSWSDARDAEEWYLASDEVLEALHTVFSRHGNTHMADRVATARQTRAQAGPARICALVEATGYTGIRDGWPNRPTTEILAHEWHRLAEADQSQDLAVKVLRFLAMCATASSRASYKPDHLENALAAHHAATARALAQDPSVLGRFGSLPGWLDTDLDAFVTILRQSSPRQVSISMTRAARPAVREDVLTRPHLWTGFDRWELVMAGLATAQERREVMRRLPARVVFAKAGKDRGASEFLAEYVIESAAAAEDVQVFAAALDTILDSEQPLETVVTVAASLSG